ncbi:BRO-N domain-containing protein [Heyndrickxia faecalis]|uniref:BRO-N domain-containing protein n=1 Tax=Heyndrickxia faecalis TaxID=2824910 RepID=UPI003D197C66
MARLEEDERPMLNIGRQGATNLVNEPGLYSLIMSSQKLEARTFKRWITHDVIPQIRKTGSYSTQVPQTFSEALRLAADLQEEIEKAKPTKTERSI